MTKGLRDITPIIDVHEKLQTMATGSYSFTGRFNTLRLEVKVNGEPVSFTLSDDCSVITFDEGVTVTNGDHVDISWVAPTED